MRLSGITIMALLASAPVSAQTLAGVYALPTGHAKVAATLAVVPAAGLRRMLDIAMTPLDAAKPIIRYDTELSKQVHVIAVSADLRDFIHEHGDHSAAGGHFRVAMTFPHTGLWHVYADASPVGLGQQVMRFNLTLGQPGPAMPEPASPPTNQAADGRYAVRFDALDLKAGQETMLTLHLLHDGKPAADVMPFLGVAAHAVLIDASDLSYVHVHAIPGGVDGMEAMPGMGKRLAPGSKVPSDLTIHATAPRAGDYVLWIQFNGGGTVRTVRFRVAVG